ncbi:hypothetical protein QYF48_12110 [Brevibacillus agri]|uniref:hypothetical protein n=1 Tax=Brevibacillus agri TaxID=51101 RepID=UPI0025B71950|nr:hypothetical protein [Brevibacillus agri]MDN4093559.1 hypothetical protein [Brevibacillus agri]
MSRKNISDDIDLFSLVNLTSGYRVQDFECDIKEYELFIKNDALQFQELNIARTYLLINKTNADIVAYMSLVSDSIRLSEQERGYTFPATILFSSFPAIKIGKLAVSKPYKEIYKGIGSLMIELARGIAEEINQSVACKFITVDADVENDPKLPEFYGKNSFVFNEAYNRGSNRRTISMRLNILNDEQDVVEHTGT